MSGVATRFMRQKQNPGLAIRMLYKTTAVLVQILLVGMVFNLKGPSQKRSLPLCNVAKLVDPWNMGRCGLPEDA